VALIVALAALNVLLSPEIAVAFVLGWIGYSTLVVIADRSRWRLIPASVAALAIVAVAAHLLLPEAYYGSLLSFSQGAHNLPILPAVHILLYLLTLVLIVPPQLAAGWRGQTQDAPLGRI
jgi:hypothetical protein